MSGLAGLSWGLAWMPPPPSTDEPERPVDLPNLDFLAVLLANRAGEWARLLSGLDRSLARRVAAQVERDRPDLDAIARALDARSPAGPSWGVWARCRPTEEAAVEAPAEVEAPAPTPAPPVPAQASPEPAAEATRAAEAPAPAPTPDAAPVRAVTPPRTPPAPSAVVRLSVTDDERALLRGFAPVRKGTTAHRTDLDYARLAQVYARLVADGDTAPAHAIREACGLATSSAVNVHIKEARTRGYLTAPAGPRRPGGTLTATARSVLDSAPSPAASSPAAPVRPVPHPPAPAVRPAAAPRPAPPVQVRPTLEQQAAIDRLRAEGEAHVAGMRRPTVTPRGILPDTCRPIASVRDLPEHLRPAAEAAIADGWVIGKQANGHHRWEHEDRSPLVTSSGSTHNASRANLGTLRRAGIKVPDYKQAPKEEGGAETPAPATDGSFWKGRDIGAACHAYAKKYAQGLDADPSWYDEVTALDGFSERIALDAVRSPQAVSIRPESIGKGYPILLFRRGDVDVVVGFRDPHAPMVLASYSGSRLDADTHRVNYTGGGGSRSKGPGVPSTPGALVKRLRDLGAEVTDTSGLGDRSATVRYAGDDLGSVTIAPHTPRGTVETDWQRMQRKIAAISNRALAGKA